MKSLENKTPLIFDIFFCVVVMPVLILLGPAYYWMSHWPLFSVLVCVFLYGSYFVVRWLRLPRRILAGDYYRIAAVVAGLVAANYLLTVYPHPDVDFITPSLSRYHTRVRDYSISLSLWLMFSLVVASALTVSFVTELYEQMLQKRRVEAQRDKAKLAVFKAQISPHFLFNTLNSLYSLVIGKSQQAEDAFIKFTELLKYSYVTIENESVPVSDEIAYIQNYIDLQRIRLDGHTTVDWQCDVDDPQLMIPPMLMLTFVENAFKYGASTSRDCTISIALRLRGGHLEFTTENSIMKHSDTFRAEVPVGVDNCRARLEGIFKSRYSLVTQEADGRYNVCLKIDIV